MLAVFRDRWLTFSAVGMALLTGSGCDSDDLALRTGPAASQRIPIYDEGTPEMLAAMQQAADTLPDFIAAVQHPLPDQRGFAIKYSISDGDETEYFWLHRLEYENGQWTGSIDNEPEFVRTVRLGQQLQFSAEQIADWMYIENGKLIGGYTIHVLRDRMSETDRREFDAAAPFRIE